MKKSLLFLCLLLISITFTSYAQITKNDGENIQICGNFDAGDIPIAIEVYKGDKTFLDLEASPDNYKDILIYWTQLKTASDGSYVVDFPIDKSTEPSRMLTAIIYSEKGYNEEVFLYTNPDNALARLREIEQKYNENRKDEISNIIRDYPYDLWIEDEYKNYYLDIADIIIKYLDENASFDDAASRIFMQASGIAALENNSSHMVNIFENSLLFDLENSSIKDFLEKDYLTQSVQESITKRLKGRNYENLKDFDDKLTEAFVLSVVSDPDGYKNTKEVMQAFSDKIGTGSSGSDKRYNYVSGKNYSDYDSLKSAFDDYKETDNTNKGSSGGGGGGGGKTSTITVESNATVIQGDLPTINRYIFDDVGDVAWAIEGIVALAEKGIISGRGNGMFEPHANITRAEFVKIVTSMFYSDYEADGVSFYDVTTDDWYYQYVAKAYSLGIIDGYPNGYFGASDFITRQDMATILYRLTLKENYIYEDITNQDVFSDDGSIGGYAKEAVYALRSIEVINGIDELMFAPLDNATRAQAVKMIYTLSEKL